MDKYINSYLVMISLRGLADHTRISYSTYIRSYLHYLSDILGKLPEVSWQELRDYIRWLQNERNLSDRTINCATAPVLCQNDPPNALNQSFFLQSVYGVVLLYDLIHQTANLFLLPVHFGSQLLSLLHKLYAFIVRFFTTSFNFSRSGKAFLSRYAFALINVPGSANCLRRQAQGFVAFPKVTVWFD